MRIPKIIYTTWISNKPLPKKFNKYIDSWKKHLPGYEIRMLTMENVPENKFIDTFIEKKKYAVAAQYARAMKIYETGGIYFDIDVEVIRNFDELLHFELFAGIENKGENNFVNNAVFGAARKHSFLKDCMRYMDSIDVNKDDIEISTGPLMFTELMKRRGWNPRNKDAHHCGKYWKDKIAKSSGSRSIQILNSKYFYPYLPDEQFTPDCISSNTFAIHHWAATWKNSISVIILCEEDTNLIEQTLVSIKEQTVKPIEIILINKFSGCNFESLKKLAYENRVKVIDKINSGGSAASMNEATDFAKGKWILILNAGETIVRNFIKKVADKSTVEKDETYIKYSADCKKFLFKKELWEEQNGFDEAKSENDAFEDLIGCVQKVCYESNSLELKK